MAFIPRALGQRGQKCSRLRDGGQKRGRRSGTTERHDQRVRWTSMDGLREGQGRDDARSSRLWASAKGC
jgi:hypothetical protein